MKTSSIFKILFLFFSLGQILFFSNTLFASHEKEKQLTVEDAFKSVNKILFTLEETKKYCNNQFSKQVTRNTEAYEQWELQYSFFLREFDTNYANWKSGFKELEQQQFATLEFIERELIKTTIEKEYREGGIDKCYNFKPSLTRPRNNIELSLQESINLIRNNSLNSYLDDRASSGAHAACVWQQNKAIQTAELRNQGKDLKAQKMQLKEMKKAKDNTDKKQKSEQLSSYSSMISDIYQAPSINILSFSQYRFALCERNKNDIDSLKFKKSLPLILNCQEKNVDAQDLLGSCINKSLKK